ncbi:MAG: hypothetical protein ACTS4X_02100, partial [Candidatus Hodgkinia cicadicola]
SRTISSFWQQKWIISLAPIAINFAKTFLSAMDPILTTETSHLFNKYLVTFARLINAAVGATRAAVEAGVAPPFCYVELTLMKNFVKAIDGKKYLKEKFLTISDAKLKEGIFVGLQIRELKKDENVEWWLNDLENVYEFLAII